MDIDIQYLRGWIGREEVAEETATPELARRFAATMGLPLACKPGDVAPGMLHLCLCQPAAPQAELGPDGHPARGGFLPPVPLPRRMWAGGEMVIGGEIRLGERVSRISRIRDVTLKEGRSGRLCFVTAVDHRIESAGRLVLEERQDVVYRDPEPAGSGGAALAATRTPPEKMKRRVTPTPMLLFRYSALTFNGHRIHYDLPWAREAEGYPGLVVHGPLQATLLLHLAQEMLGGVMPRRFRFRGLSPLFDTADLELCAEPTDMGLRLWTAGSNGRVAMEAFAEV